MIDARSEHQSAEYLDKRTYTALAPTATCKVCEQSTVAQATQRNGALHKSVQSVYERHIVRLMQKRGQAHGLVTVKRQHMACLLACNLQRMPPCQISLL